MIKKHFIKSGVTALILCSFTQASVAATLHKPEEAWIVKPISAKKGKEPGYCAMKNHFKDGPTMIVARDTTGATAIALDFHKDKFDTGIRYNVKATAGSVTRNVDGLAASKQVLLMQMGIDTEFFGALAHDHNATFVSGKNTYGFDLDASAADALAALGHCSASLQVGMTFAAAQFPLGTAHSQSLKEVAGNAAPAQAESIDATDDAKTAGGKTAAESIDATVDNKTANNASADVKSVSDKAAGSKTASSKIKADVKVAESKAAPVASNTTTDDKAAGDKIADNVQDIAEGKTAGAGYYNDQPVAPKKHHKQVKNNTWAPDNEHPYVEVTQQEPPSASQVDAVRDDIKTEIASELLSLKASEDAQKSGPAIAAMPVSPVEASSIAGTANKEPVKTAETKPAEVKAAEAKIAPPAAQAVNSEPVVSAALPAPVAPMPPTVRMADPTVVAENTKLKNEVSTLKALAAAQADLANLKHAHEQALTDMQMKLAQKDKQIQQMESTSSNASKALADAQAQISALKREHIEKLESIKKETEQAFAEMQSKIDVKEKQYDELQEALNAKDKDLSSIRSLSSTDSKALAAAQAELAKVQAENASLKREQAQSATDLQARLAKLTSDYNNLKTQDDALKMQNAALAQAKEKAALQAEMANESLRAKSAAIAAAAITPAAAPQQQTRTENIDLKSLLLSSHVLSDQQIKVGDNGSDLHWSADGLFGSAQQSPLPAGKSLADTASDYLHKTASLCKGDFGQKIGQVQSTGNLNVLEADITCIDGQNDAAAAVLFVSNQGMFSVITEEGTVDQLHTAMTNRDAIITAALGNGPASSVKIRDDFDAPAGQQHLLQNNVTSPLTTEPVPLASD